MYKLVVILYCFSTAAAAFFGGRIVNGTDATYGEIPYIVSLRLINVHICGASILNEKYILTAAHCVFPFPFYSIQYGITHISYTSNAPNLIQVRQLIVHENYNSGPGQINDVAIGELEESIPLGEFVTPIHLPVAFSATPENANATLSGWGLSSSEGPIVDDLQKVSIQVYSDDDCERIHQLTGPTNRTFHICAGVPEGGKGQCIGDSGGPLVVDGIQVGIVSWSVKPCTEQGYPGVFTKVSNYIDWIVNKIN